MEQGIMKQLIDYAWEKMEKNNAYPFCAFIVKDNKIISQGYNSRVNDFGDKTMHGEMEAMKNACKVLKKGIYLNDYSLFTTCEPCLACFDAALWSKINTFVFSVDHTDFPEYFNDHSYTLENYEAKNPGQLHIIRKVLHTEGLELFNTAKNKYGW